MNKSFYLIFGIVALIIFAVGWYAYKYRSCLKQINYIPPREARDLGDGFYGALHSVDTGDYVFFSQKFKTSDDALRACIWK